jgi:hypothetical protein
MENNELTPEQQAIIIVEKLSAGIRTQIANEVERHFHGIDHDLAHDVAKFIREGKPTIA